MPRVIIYTTNYCPYCFGAKAFLRSKEVEFEEVDVTDDPPRRAEMGSVCLVAERCRRFLSTANHLVVTTISSALMPAVNWTAY
jgi:arsenate reductase-like glutaredoxin family protein